MSLTPPGTPPRSGAPRPLRGIPRSHAYWELKAEQMMNRVFDPAATIDIGGEPEQKADPEPPRSPISTAAGRRSEQSSLLAAALAGVCLVSAASAIFYVSHWNRLQQSLSQERNLLLMERLRALGPASSPTLRPPPEPATPNLPLPSSTALAPADTGSEGLPPPPPEEPWIQQLSTLPGSRTTPPLLQVPIGRQVTGAAPQTANTTRAPVPSRAASAPVLPQLVGVVGTAGKAASAIFLVGGTSMGVASGEMIGSSGWRLRSADGENALIERGGEIRQVSIINGS